MKYVKPVFILMIGLMGMFLISNIVKDQHIATIVLVIFFCFMNLSLARFSGLNARVVKIIAPGKMWHLIVGFLFGSLPIGIAYLWLGNGNVNFDAITLWPSVFFTFLTVSWEELWFRGIPLDYAAQVYGKFGAAFVFALIFCALHALNPKIDLFIDGLQLFTASFSLSLCYFVFQSIWAPIGMHFANNILQPIFGFSSEPRTFAFIGPLIILTVLFAFLLKKKKRTSDLQDIELNLAISVSSQASSI